MINIYNTDCFKHMASMDNESVDHIFMDPPYGTLGKHKLETNVDKDALFKECYRIAKQDSFIFIFVPFQTVDEWVGSMKKAGYKSHEKFLWNKSQSSSPFAKIHRVTEDMYVLKKGKPKDQINTISFVEGTLIKVKHGFTKFNSLQRKLNYIIPHIQNYIEGKSINDLPNSNRINYKEHVIKHLNFNLNDFTHKEVVIQQLNPTQNITNLWTFSRQTNGNHNAKKFPNHPTIKPIALYERALRYLTKEGDVIFDPFLGSGTLAYAVHKQKRSLIGIEINQDYIKACTEWLSKKNIPYSLS